MKNLKFFIFFILVFIMTTTHAQESTPLAFDIAGLKVTPKDMIDVVTSAAEAAAKVAQQSRDKKERTITGLQEQLITLGKKRDQNYIGQSEFEQTQNILNDKITSLRREIEEDNKASYKTGENIQQVVMSGWQTLLVNYQEEQQRKTQIAIAATRQSIKNQGALEEIKLMSSPEYLKNYALFLGGASIGIFGAYYGVKLGHHYIEQQLDKKPLLVKETSYRGIFDRLASSLYRWFGYEEKIPTFDDTIVFTPELETEAKLIEQIVKTSHEKGLPYPPVLLYGPPGTGKTLFAKYLAQTCKRPYVIISAADLGQFAEGNDIKELNETLEYTKKAGGFIFIDEIDALGRNRATLSERWVRLLNAFLPHFSTASKEIMIIGATNRLQDLDPAFAQRFAKQVYISLPGLTERTKLFQLYLKKYIENDTRVIKINNIWTEVQLTQASEITQELITNAAQKTQDFAGREIEQMVSEMRTLCYFSDDLTLTKEIFARALHGALLRKEQAQKFIGRADTP